MVTEQTKLILSVEGDLGRGTIRRIDGSLYKSFSTLSKAVRYCEKNGLSYRLSRELEDEKANLDWCRNPGDCRKDGAQ